MASIAPSDRETRGTPSIALLGAGKWGTNHLRILYELGVLSAVVDLDPNRRKEIQTQYQNIPVYPSPEPLWGNPEIRGVVIATPAPTHAPLTLEALKAGKDVLVEKPMALNSRDAENMVRFARRFKRILMVGHLLLYQPAIAWIKEFLKEGRLGRIRRVEQFRLNFGRARKVENALQSFGVHDLAVLLYLLEAEPLRVRFLGTGSLTEGIEDDCHLFLEFPGNLHAHIHTSWDWYEKDRRLMIFGERGMLVFYEEEGEVYLHRKVFSPDLSQKDEGAERIFSAKGDPLRAEILAFLKAIEERTPPIASGEHGVQVTRILDIALRSRKRKVRNP